MPLSAGQGLEGRLRLDFQLLAGGMDHTFWKIGVLMDQVCNLYLRCKDT